MHEAIQISSVLTAIGQDRPGLVSMVSKALRDAGCNFEDSRMAILGGEFALIVLFRGTEAANVNFQNALDSLEKESGLQCQIRRTSEARMTAFTTYRLDISGFDRQGIVAAISDILSAKEVNVASLESRRVFAPESGTPMFLMNAELQISSQVSLQELQHSLQSYCDEEALELLLEMIG